MYGHDVSTGTACRVYIASTLPLGSARSRADSAKVNTIAPGGRCGMRAGGGGGHELPVLLGGADAGHVTAGAVLAIGALLTENVFGILERLVLFLLLLR